MIAETYRTGYWRLPSSSSIFRKGEAIREVFTLHEGWAYLFQNLADGGRQILRFILPGDFFGFQADMGAGVRMHSAQALSAVGLCVFPYANILSMIKNHPDIGIRLIWMTAHDEAIAYEHLVSLGRRTARERVSYLLLDLFHRLRVRRLDPNGVHTVNLPLTQELIADACGLTQIHVNRTLQSLRKDRVVDFKGGLLQVPDLQLLSAEANYSYNLFEKRTML